MDTNDLLSKLVNTKERVVAIDPGGTTGWAWIEDNAIKTHSTKDTDTTDFAMHLLTEGYELFIIEEWRLYPWMADTMSWNDMYTPKLIGKLEMLCELRNKPVVFQGAHIKKALPWCTQGRNDHERDAVKHLVHYLLSKLNTDGLITL